MKTRSDLVDLHGQRFGFLTVIARERDRRGRMAWLCLCDCGRKRHVNGNALRNRDRASCGCKKGERIGAKIRTHGASRTKEYRAWDSMIARCENKNNKEYHRYGARGITVCAEWRRDYSAFINHIGLAPDASFTVDRIDNNRGYEPGNVRWATRLEQARNRRKRGTACQSLTM